MKSGPRRSSLFMHFFKNPEKEALPVSKQSKGGNVTGTVRDLVEPYAKELGLELWDVRFVKEGAEHYLRIFIDRPEGVSIDDCVNLTHAIDAPLDRADPIPVSYTLEVSSPGLERTLSREEHFLRYLGAPVKIRLVRPMEGERDFKATLDNYDNGIITVTTEDGRSFSFGKKEASYVKLDDFDS